MRFINNGEVVTLTTTVGGRLIRVEATGDGYEALAEALARFWEAYDQAVAKAEAAGKQ